MPHRQLFHGLVVLVQLEEAVHGAAQWLCALVGVESAGSILSTIVTIGLGHADVLLSCITCGVSTDVMHFLYWSHLGVRYRENVTKTAVLIAKFRPSVIAYRLKGWHFIS